LIQQQKFDSATIGSATISLTTNRGSFLVLNREGIKLAAIKFARNREAIAHHNMVGCKVAA